MPAGDRRLNKYGSVQELVEVLVNGKNGQFISHRWKNIPGMEGENDPKNPLNSTKSKIRGVAALNGNELLKQFAIDMLTKIARDTPVDTGRATANWKAGVNEEPRPNDSLFDKSPAATATSNRAKKALDKVNVKDEIYIKNAVRSDDEGGYIIKLEHGGSKQAPTGMFMKNVVQYKRIFNRAKKKLGG